MPMAKLQPAFDGVAEEDMYVLDIQKNIIDYLKKAYVIVPEGGGGGSGMIIFSSLMALLESIAEFDDKGNNIGFGKNSEEICKLIPNGTEFICLGYYNKNDGGRANYISSIDVDITKSPWAKQIGISDVPDYVWKMDEQGNPVLDKDTGEKVHVTDDKGNWLINKNPDGTDKYMPLYAVINEQTEVNYRQFGAIMDGKTDDYTAIMWTHKYADSHYYNEKAIKDGSTTQQFEETTRRVYTCTVANHSGIIYKKNDTPITFAGNCDLSGSTLLVDDTNAAWFGFYVYGDNEQFSFSLEPQDETKATYKADKFVIGTKGAGSHLGENVIQYVEESNYSVRDDGGYMYQNARKELWYHHKDGILTTPLTTDWTDAGGMQVNVKVSDINDITNVRTETFYTDFKTSYTVVPSQRGFFKGCLVNVDCTANKYITVFWVKRHNCDITDWTFKIPSDKTLISHIFRNSMIYLWDVYNVRVANIKGFNGTGKKDGSANGSSGYILRLGNTLEVTIEDCDLTGYWGATAFYWSHNTYIKRCRLNRLDTHDYYNNMWVENCDFFQHGIQIGFGRGITSISHCNFFYEDIPADSWPHAHLLEFDLTYGRVFEGQIYINDCTEFIRGITEFDIFKVEFHPDASCILPKFRLPEVYVKDCTFIDYGYENGSHNATVENDSTPKAVFCYYMVSGSTDCTTSDIAPSHLYNHHVDNEVIWHYEGRGVDWWKNGEVFDGQYKDIPEGRIIRVQDSFIDSNTHTTTFYNKRYYRVTKSGTLPDYNEALSKTLPTRDGQTCTLGSAELVCVEHALWEGKKQYAVGDYVAVDKNSWFPLYCFKCIKAGVSAGKRPTHSATDVGESMLDSTYGHYHPATAGVFADANISSAVMEQDGVWWKYVKPLSEFTTKEWVVGEKFENHDIFYVDHRLYEATKPGVCTDIPPTDTPWLGVFNMGNNQFRYLGGEWEAGKWYEHNSYCVSNGNVYIACYHAGTTVGAKPVPGSRLCLDGDIIWEWVAFAGDAEAPTPNKTWNARTAYNVGDVISVNGSIYRCYFNGELEMFGNMIFENIRTNMPTYGGICHYEQNTDIKTRPTKLIGNSVLKFNNCPGITASNYFKGKTKFFGNSANENPDVYIDNVKVN